MTVVEEYGGKMEQTTVRLDRDVKQQLEKLKIIEQEPINDVVKRLLDFVASIVEGDDDGILNSDARKLLQTQLHEVKEGKVVSTDEMRRRLLRKENSFEGERVYFRSLVLPHYGN